ncbi:hypothetical protein LTR66_011420 [Elasticomyces elasticus]|nr:hypothetical protein LTR66_011420 [Elasticomyces elasticus]
MIASLKAASSSTSSSSSEQPIDVAIGLTEGFIADIGKSNSAGKDPAFKLAGTYVETPLCWAISTGGKREIGGLGELKGKKVGVSRIGSGSYVMSFVLADQHGWLSSDAKTPFEVVPLGDFKALRGGVNGNEADFFMWEHFTSKRYFDNGELKRLGELYTPWPSWMIAARDPTDKRLEDLAEKLNKGIVWFNEHRDESVKYIYENLDYSKEDAEEWIKGVKFAENVRGVNPTVVEDTVGVLRKAGVLDEKSGSVESIVAIKNQSRGS